MNFEEALRLMYDGHICKDASCLDESLLGVW